MRKILIIMGRYLPGYKDGGPVRSIKNMTDCLGDEYDFRILTADRDHGDTEPYPGIIRGDWNTVGKAKVWYAEPGGFTSRLVGEKASEADVVYICGCFNNYARVALKLKKQGKIAGKVFIASMGLFSPGAFRIKYLKKKLYMEALKMGGYFRGIEWSATGPEEAGDIKRIVGDKSICHIAQDMPLQMERIPEPVEKTEEGLRIIFLSRISLKKNLSCAVEILQKVTEKIVFDVYGTLEDEAYYDECLKKAGELPDNVLFAYKGEARPDQVIDTFTKYHVFLFPTMGENYGHVIYEAMAGGCIPVISDRTPWKEIGEKKIGWVIPLEDKQQFTETIQKLAGEDNAVCMDRQKKAAEYAWEYGRNVGCEGYRDIFGR